MIGRFQSNGMTAGLSNMNIWGGIAFTGRMLTNHLIWLPSLRVFWDHCSVGQGDMGSWLKRTITISFKCLSRTNKAGQRIAAIVLNHRVKTEVNMSNAIFKKKFLQSQSNIYLKKKSERDKCPEKSSRMKRSIPNDFPRHKMGWTNTPL